MKKDRKEVLDELTKTDILDESLDDLLEDLEDEVLEEDMVDEDILDSDQDYDLDVDDDTITDERDDEPLQARIDRDWRAVDYAVFGSRVDRTNFPDEFVTEWATLKTVLLQKFYRDVSPFVKLDCCNSIEDIEESAKHLAQKARKLAILKLKEHRRETRPLATKLVKEVFINRDNPEDAMERATKLMIAHESLCNLIGGPNSIVKDMMVLVARYYK